MLPTVARRVVTRLSKTPAAAAATTAGAVRCISVGGCVPNVKVKEVREALEIGGLAPFKGNRDLFQEDPGPAGSICGPGLLASMPHLPSA